VSNRTTKILLALSVLLFAASACNAQFIGTEPTSAPTQIIEPVFTQSQSDLPLTETEAPRVTVEAAKAALDSGAAVIVDVRDPVAYETSHIAGAINIQLGEIETNPTGLNLDKDQWIITYCA